MFVIVSRGKTHDNQIRRRRRRSSRGDGEYVSKVMVVVEGLLSYSSLVHFMRTF
jgi:hypothetical protein